MNKNRINIAIIEPSCMIYEGLTNIIMKAKRNCFVYRFSDLSELDDFLDKSAVDFAIINPSCIQNRTQDLTSLKRQHTNISWVSLVYSHHDNTLLSHFNETISILDSSITIVEKLDHSLVQNSTKYIKAQLSEREIEVLKELVSGLTNKEIADKLFISIHTVISHRKNIVEKTGIKSLPGLTIFAISQNITSLNTIPQ